MTLLFFDGFDNAKAAPKPEWDTANVWNTVTAGRDTIANGAVTSGPIGAASKVLTLPTPAATLLCGFAFKIGNNSAFGNATVPWFTAQVNGTDSLAFNWDATGHLLLRSGDQGATVRATSPTAFVQGQWYHLQFRLVASSTAATVQVYINGAAVPDINYTGVGGPTGSITALRFGNGNNSVADSFAYDDVWVCDAADATATQGRPNNTLLGDLKVLTLLPTGAGDVTQWTPSTAVANYTTVDENPLNVTDYVAAATTGLQDLYAMADVSNVQTVYGVRAGHYAQKTDAGAAFIKPLLKQGNGTLTTQATVGLTSGAWAGVWAAILPAKADGTVWSAADVNALQVGIESA